MAAMAEQARLQAVNALMKIHQGGGYSHIVLENMRKDSGLSGADRGLFTALVYGTVERRLTIDYFLSRVSAVKLKRIHPFVLEVLRTAVYQLLFLDKIPPSAAVNEAVELAKRNKQKQAAGFVNGVLRGIIRKQADIWASLPQGEEGLSIRYSCPLPLLRLWRGAYGELTDGLLASLYGAPPATVRVNTLKTTAEDLLTELEKSGCRAEKHPILPDCLVIQRENGIKLDFLEEKCYYQDAASQAAVLALSPQEGERLADVCAAPGGKSLTAALLMCNKGSIQSGDLYPEKCGTIAHRAERLSISIIETAVRDASQPCKEEWRSAFDRVMCDVPCSGYGVIRRKPEIRYRDPAQFATLPELQLKILHESAAMVRPGGVLQYSTCTLSPRENEAVAVRFLAEHPDFEPRTLTPLVPFFEQSGLPVSGQITLFPHLHQTDGFFIAGFVKR